MNAVRRTLVFVAVAAVSVGLAAMTQILTKPSVVEGFEKVGKKFYPDFDDPSEAKALRVVAYNEDTASARIFNVESKDGRWRIPSRHNYPAEGTKRLAETAASVIGIERTVLAGRRKSEHERFGVIDPLDDTTSTLKGRGQRITLFKDGDKVLVDYIIGEQPKGRTGEYYVRRADEKETYRTKLSISLSAKFSDWIEPDLLKLDRYDLVEIAVYSRPDIDSEKRIAYQEISKLSRSGSSDPWKLEGLNEEEEELRTDDIREMVDALDDLEIVGVRPKRKGITADLKVSPSIANNPQAVGSLLRDLMSIGFGIGVDRSDNLRLYSQEGEVVAATNQGAVYHLHFGNLFTGDEEEIEFGKGNQDDQEDDDRQKKDETNEADDGGKSEDDNGKENQSNKEGVKAGRYLFVRVEFDADYVGEQPKKPVEPEQPAGPAEEGSSKKESGDAPGKKDASDEKAESAGGEAEQVSQKESSEADEKDTDEPKSNGRKKPEEEKQADPEEEKKADDTGKSDKDGEDKKDPQQAEYEEALAKYNQDLEKYENDLEEYKEKLKKGREKVDELNDRFGEWYYVISAEHYKNLRLARKDFVKPKQKSDEQKKQPPLKK